MHYWDTDIRHLGHNVNDGSMVEKAILTVSHAILYRFLRILHRQYPPRLTWTADGLLRHVRNEKPMTIV